MNLIKKNRILKSVLFISLFFFLFYFASKFEFSEEIMNFFLSFEAIQLDEIFLVFFLILIILLILILSETYNSLKKQKTINSLSNLIERLSVSNTIPTIVIEDNLTIELLNPAAKKIFKDSDNNNKITDLLVSKDPNFRFDILFKKNNVNELPDFLNKNDNNSLLELSYEKFQIENKTKVLFLINDLSDMMQKHKILENQLDDSRKIGLREMKLLEVQKKTIARELHDEFSQILTLISLETDKIQAYNTSKGIKTAINRILDYLKRIKNSTRHIIKMLRPPALDEIGLKAAVEQMIYEWSKTNSKIKIKLNYYEFEIKNDLIRIFLYRIIQELITNVQKHSEAKTIIISIINIKTSNEVELVFYEDGNGFEVIEKAMLNSNGNGLNFIKERVRSLDGSFELSSGDNNFFSYTIRLKL